MANISLRDAPPYGKGSSYLSKNNQCAVCSRSLPVTGTDFCGVIWHLKMAAVISLVNSLAAGTAKLNDTHFLTRRCKVFTVTKGFSSTTLTRVRKLCFFLAFSWNTSQTESERKPRYRTVFLGTKTNLASPKK